MMLGPFPKPLSAPSNALYPVTDHVGRPCRGCCRSGWQSTLRSPCPFQSREKVIKWCGVGVGVATGSRVMGSGPKRTRVEECAKGKEDGKFGRARTTKARARVAQFLFGKRGSSAMTSGASTMHALPRASKGSCAVNGKMRMRGPLWLWANPRCRLFPRAIIL
jgi:hypothetical protein